MKAALKTRNLQLFFGGQMVSCIGTWMQQMALGWMVYRLSGSPLMLGVIGFASQIPSLFLTPFSGIIADRTNRRRLLMITQMAAMLQAFALTALVWNGHQQLWQLIALSAVLGAIGSFELPTRQSFIVDMLDDKEHLAAAIGMNSSINTLTRFVGPFVAGVIVSWAGERICFLSNALSYFAVIVALMFIKSRQVPAKPSKSGAIEQIKEGFEYTMGHTVIRDLIALVALVAFFGTSFATLLPAFAKDVFHGTAFTLGLLTGGCGAGSLLGALFLTSRKGMQELGKWIVAGCALCGIAVVILGSSTYLPVSLLAVTVAGFGSMISIAGAMTIIQTVVDGDKRGRVMSFVVMAFLGIGPFGTMAAGALANVIGPGLTVAATGMITLALAFAFGAPVMQLHTRVTPAEISEGVAEVESEMTAA